MRDTNETRGSLSARLPQGGQQTDDAPPSMRHLIESSGVPFAAVEYARRRPVFHQGDACGDLIYIERGAVMLAVSLRSGKEAICGVLGVGAFLGEEALMGQSVRRHSAIALTPTTALVIAKPHMLRLVHTQPAIADRFIKHLIARNARLEVDLTDQLLYPAEQRLAHTLLALGGCDETRPRRCVLPDISQEALAEMVGTTRSRVNGFLARFKRAGFIEKDRGHLYVCAYRVPAGWKGSRPVDAGSSAVSPSFTSDESRWLRAG